MLVTTLKDSKTSKHVSSVFFIRCKQIVATIKVPTLVFDLDATWGVVILCGNTCMEYSRSNVGIENRPGVGLSGVRISAGGMSRSVPVSSHPPVQWVKAFLSPGVKRPGSDSDHSLASSRG